MIMLIGRNNRSMQARVLSTDGRVVNIFSLRARDENVSVAYRSTGVYGDGTYYSKSGAGAHSALSCCWVEAGRIDSSSR